MDEQKKEWNVLDEQNEWDGMEWIEWDDAGRRLRSLQNFPIIRFRMHKAMKEQVEERKTTEE